SYNAVKVGGADVLNPGRERIVPHPDGVASPDGWHFSPEQGGVFKTAGNNVRTHTLTPYRLGTRFAINYAHSATDDFDFELDLQQNPKKHPNATVANVDYVSNYMHDKLYGLGFDEEAGNFQFRNPSGLGKERDPIDAQVHGLGGKNLAVFTAPPDGEMGQLFLGIFGSGSKARDSGLDNTVVIHELGHGLSKRLTGGSHNADCLATTLSGGLGEGVSDALAVLMMMKSTDTRDTSKFIGKYTSASMRRYPYTTNMEINPLTYKSIKKYNDVHAIGTVWGTMLYEMYWNLVDALGFDEVDAKPDITKGSTLALQLIIDALKTQPCHPDFIQARNHILEAEQRRTNGAHACKIWAAFAKRGLGSKAKYLKRGLTGKLGITGPSPVEDYDVPIGCQSESGEGRLSGRWVPSEDDWLPADESSSDSLSMSIHQSSTV
ncbi:peptidase M36, partial [Thamnocephalis sphaerospora]